MFLKLGNSIVNLNKVTEITLENGMKGQPYEYYSLIVHFEYRCFIQYYESKEEVNKQFEKIMNWQFITRKAANYITTHLYLQDQVKEMIYLKEDIRVRLANYAKDENGVLNSSYQSSVYKILTKKFKGDIPMISLASLSNELVSVYRNERDEVFQGKRSIKNFRNDIPVKVPKQLIKSFDIDSEGEYVLELYSGVSLKIIFGKDKSNNQAIVGRVLAGKYKLKDSSLKYDRNKKKLFLYFVVGLPKNKRKLDESVVVGMNLGLNNPLYAALNNGKGWYIGNKEEFLYKRRQIQEGKDRKSVV